MEPEWCPLGGRGPILGLPSSRVSPTSSSPSRTQGFSHSSPVVLSGPNSPSQSHLLAIHTQFVQNSSALCGSERNHVRKINWFVFALFLTGFIQKVLCKVPVQHSLSRDSKANHSFKYFFLLSLSSSSFRHSVSHICRHSAVVQHLPVHQNHLPRWLKLYTLGVKRHNEGFQSYGNVLHLECSDPQTTIYNYYISSNQTLKIGEFYLMSIIPQ